MSQYVEVTQNDLELIESLEFDPSEDKHCESSGHSLGNMGHSETQPLWYAKFGCDCLFDGAFIVCEAAVDFVHNLIVMNNYDCPFGWLMGNSHKTDIIKIEPVK